MVPKNDQFQYEILPSHFEKDTHEQIRQLQIDSLYILSGNLASEDILVVMYQNSPLLSFYDVKGRLIDVDHYLPDNYTQFDVVGTHSVVRNLENYDEVQAKKQENFKRLLDQVIEKGGNNLINGLKVMYGLIVSEEALASAIDMPIDGLSSSYLSEQIQATFYRFDDFLDKLITNYQKTENGYVHITSNDNIVITPLNKRSGLAVIIETRDLNGNLLPANKWNIVRTKSTHQLDKALVFRSSDIKEFFTSMNYESTYETDRYKLYNKPGIIQIDSYLDNTDNLLQLRIVDNCYQILASDNNILIILSNDQEITVINTHKSVIPQKWPRKILIPFDTRWMRVDENLSCLFAQDKNGDIVAFDITGDHPEKLSRLGNYDIGFAIDQRGDLMVSSENGLSLDKIRTNIYDLRLGADLDSFTNIFKDISHLFKGESLFTKAQYAKDISEIEPEEEEKLPSAIELARYDFETSIEHMLLTSGDSYDSLLEIKNKIAIARQNIAEELTSKSEKLGVILVGQRLKSSIANIVGPMEGRVNTMVNKARSQHIINTVRNFKSGMSAQSDTDEYREMLNNVRRFENELRSISHDVDDEIITEFKVAQEEMNALFANQITNDENALNNFIAGEIDQVEKAILNIHDLQQLEIVLSTHPASLELMSLLKQPFVLQSVGKGKRFSPSMIQTRLHDKVDRRRDAIEKVLNKKEAQKNAAKNQLAEMINNNITFFARNHSGGFSDQELTSNATHETIQSDIRKLEKEYNDVRLAQDLRRKLTRKILDRNREDLEKLVAFEGKYAYVQNDPDLFVDMDSNEISVPAWNIQLIEKKGYEDTYNISYQRVTDKEVHKVSTEENLKSGKAFEVKEDEYKTFSDKYEWYIDPRFTYHLLDAAWNIYLGESRPAEYPQFTKDDLDIIKPDNKVEAKSLRCALEKRYKEYQEKTRTRYVPKIGSDFIDETPYFQSKLNEFMIKAKLQKLSGSGIILLAGPPSTGKSVFLKFVSSIMNREYFEHTSDKWQTKNSLVTAIKFGEYGPYSIPAGFTKAITTSNSLINIEEIKEWPEALRKSLNPFFAGSKIFTAPDGTKYDIGENILLCAAANLGSMYRQDDEPFTADFWSRIEVVEYNYAPEVITQDYFKDLLNHKRPNLVTMQDLVRHYFNYFEAPKEANARAIFFAQQFLDFILLPKADETVKRANLANYINEYFIKNKNSSNEIFNPEEAIKIAFKRIKDFRGLNTTEFYTLYNHFCNGGDLKGNRLIRLQSSDVGKYEQLKTLFLIIRHIEGCLRELRHLFYTSAGQTEIEGTNREFIKCVHLLGLLGKI